MTDRELMRMALNALITAELDGNCEYGATEALRTALAQPEPEPVAWVSHNAGLYPGKPDESLNPLPLYLAPPQREFVGLTDEEINTLAATPAAIPGSYVHSFARAIEAKLKEENK